MVDNWDFSYNLKKPLNLDAEPNPPINVSSVDQDAMQTPEQDPYAHNSQFYHRYSLDDVRGDVNEQDIEQSDYQDSNGYDEDLRRMMIEAGFFRSQYSHNNNNENNGNDNPDFNIDSQFDNNWDEYSEDYQYFNNNPYIDNNFSNSGFSPGSNPNFSSLPPHTLPNHK